MLHYSRLSMCTGGGSGCVDLRGEITLDNSLPRPTLFHSDPRVLQEHRLRTQECEDLVSCEAAARRPSGRRHVVTTMGLCCVVGGGVFQQPTADAGIRALLKVRDLKLENSLIIVSLSESLGEIFTG